VTGFPLSGGCLCGRVRYRVVDKPESTSICHCRTCRRAAGAQSVAWAVVLRRNFELVEGVPTKYFSSKGVTRTFCASCGTTLTFEDCAETIDVTLASLDDPEKLTPTKEIWLEHRISWNPANPSLSGFSRGTGGSTA
jgi:hypothetical protein